MGFKSKFVLGLMMTLSGFSGRGQEVLESYIATGLKNNPGIKEKEAELGQYEAKLNQSKSYFMPSVSFDTRYSVSGGGRVIEFPLGDLFNPVYDNITKLYQLQGIPVTAPEPLQNQEFPFLRPTEHETKLRMIQPLYNPDIAINYKISKKRVEAARLELKLAKRELVKDIKQAYYQYLEATQMRLMWSTTQKLVAENMRVAKSLYANQKVTRDKVYRAEAELKKVEQKIIAAGNTENLTEAYFNTLLNRDLDAAIEEDSGLELDIRTYQNQNIDSLYSQIENRREELLYLKNYQEISRLSETIYKMKATPQLNAVVDYGFQGEKYQFTANDDYYLASFILSWNLFKGFQNKNKILESRYRSEMLDYRYLAVCQKIKLEVLKALGDYSSSLMQWDAAKAEMNAAQSNLNLVNKKYSNGMAGQLEYLDALSTLTTAHTKKIIAFYEAAINKAQLEKAACLYPLNK